MSTFKRIIYMVALLMAQPCFSQNWLPVGSGLDCPYVNYVRVLNLKENNEGLLIAGMIFGTNGSDGVCDTMLAAITWNGEQYSAIAEQNMTNLSTYVFDFQ